MTSRPKIFMPFYIAEYLSDTLDFSTLEHGAYLLLLFHYWRTAKRLPDDPVRLARIARVADTDWVTVSVTVMDKFDRIFEAGEGEEEGRWVWVNTNLEKKLDEAFGRMAKQKAASDKANAAKRAAAERLKLAGKKTETVTETDTDSGAYPKSKAVKNPSPTEKDSPEPPAAGPVIPMVLKIELPTNKTGEMFPITDKQFDAWEELYPSVDVMMELRKMRGWLDASPRRRKTKGGMLKFANAWLSRQQDEGGNSAQPARKGQERRPAAHSRLIAGAALAIGELNGAGQVHGAGDDSGHTPSARHPDRESGIVEDSPGEDSGSDADRNNHPAGGTVHPLLGSGADGKPAEIEIPAFLLRSKGGNPQGNQ